MAIESAESPSDPRTYTLEVGCDGRAWRWIGLTRAQIPEVIRTTSGAASFKLHPLEGHDLRLFNLSPGIATNVLVEPPIVRPLELKDAQELLRLRIENGLERSKPERSSSDLGSDTDPSTN